MDFELRYTDDQQRFRAEVVAWLDENAPPDLNRATTSMADSESMYRVRRGFGQALGARGWLYPDAPREYGGGGLGFDELIVLEEESSRRGITLPPYYDSGGRLGSASICVWGSEAQKQALLPPIYHGAVRTWQLLTEPSAGSDLAGITSTAIRHGDSYVLNGQKCYIGSAHGADRLWVIAVTDPGGKRHHNLSWFMIDANLPGITISPQYMFTTRGECDADNFGHKNTVFFDDVRVPADALVGGENQGWRVATTHLELEHGGAGSIRPNVIWERLLTYCQEHHRDGAPLIADADVRAKLTEIYIKLESVRLLGVRNFWMAHAHEPRSYEGAQHSYVRKTTGLWLTKAILDLLGPEAITADPVRGALAGLAETQQRSGIVEMHPGGTTDIQRVVIARRLGIGKREREPAGQLRSA